MNLITVTLFDSVGADFNALKNTLIFSVKKAFRTLKNNNNDIKKCSTMPKN